MKTWTDLVGPYQEGDHVDGNRWVRPDGERRKILWTFDTESDARSAFAYWQAGK